MTLDWRRIVAGGSVAGTGLVLLAVTLRRLVGGGLPIEGVLFGGLGAAIGLALLAAGVLLARASFTPAQTLRIAGWNLLGVTVLVVAMALLMAYQARLGTPVAAPVFSAAVVVGVSAVAHVLIGVNDVRRIRAGELAREREKLAVLNRLVRHNLRSEAQLLYGYATRVRGANGTDAEAVAADVHAVGDRLAEIHEHIKRLQDVIEGGSDRVDVFELRDVAEPAADRNREAHPDATVTVDVPEGLAVRANDRIGEAVHEVVENAIVHNDSSTPTVTLSGSRTDDGRVQLRVVDDGPGIEESERAVVTGDRPITQLEHGSGLGLWLVRWILEAGGGRLGFEDRRERDGSAVVLSFPAA